MANFPGYSVAIPGKPKGFLQACALYPEKLTQSIVTLFMSS